MLGSLLEEPFETMEVQQDGCPAVAVCWPQEVIAPGEDALTMSVAPGSHATGFNSSQAVATSHKSFWAVFGAHLWTLDGGNHLPLYCVHFVAQVSMSCPARISVIQAWEDCSLEELKARFRAQIFAVVPKKGSPHGPAVLCQHIVVQPLSCRM